MINSTKIPMSWRIGSAMLCALGMITIGAFYQQAQAQGGTGRVSTTRPDMKSISDRMNSNTLWLVTATPGLTYAAFGYDLANVLNDGDNFRILPVISQSALHNVRDVRFLHGVDRLRADQHLRPLPQVRRNPGFSRENRLPVQGVQ
jgi:hypothetical protein